MKTMLALSRQRRLRVCGWIAACTMAATTLGAQSVAPRISSEIASSELSTLKGSLHPLAQAQFDAGRVPATTKLNGISMVFNRSAAQQADLEALIAAQQNPSSPLFHQWLNPDQFAARFGMAQSDLDKVESWLQQQGFSIDSVARSRNLIRFSGTVRQVEQAFSTEMHYYKAEGVQHFAPSTELQVPSAIAPVVLAIRNLDDFRPKSQVVLNKNVRAKPSFTSSLSTSVFFAPGDIKTVYDINPLINSGNNGTGQSIAVVGQSAIDPTDIANFQNAAILTVKAPTLVLVPGTGTSTPFSGDELESDLDLEWSGAIAPGADISYVYTGSNTNFGAFDSIQYAIDEKIGNIISVSYGDCETDLGSANAASLDSIIQQAATQGQTVISSSGDNGSTGCSGYTNLTTTQQEALAVDYPASSAWVTGMGGTAISQANAAYLTQGDGYWLAQSSSDIVNSALQYIPEVAWNDDAANCGQTDCLSASGGGASAFFTKPAWQTGVTGIPADGKRDVPDIALYSSPYYPGYLYCSSDSSSWSSGQAASCNSGFRDSSSELLTVAGGTSFAAPIFSGMLAIINQKAGYTTGQGLINRELYKLAANSTKYASAFHDITSGNNDCTAGSAFCSSTAGFSAGVGYDQVTGLGSVDLNNLATAWPANTGSTAALVSTTTTVSASNTAPASGASVTFTITVAADSGSTVPTGTVTLQIDGGGSSSYGTGTTTTASLSANGTATYITSFSTVGAHQVIAQYPGNATFAASVGVASATIAGTSSGSGSFKVGASPATLTVTRGSSGTETITVTPAGGYTGTVLLTFNTSNNSALTNLCYNFTNITSSGYGPVTITGTAAVTTQFTLSIPSLPIADRSRRAQAACHYIVWVESILPETTAQTPHRWPWPLRVCCWLDSWAATHESSAPWPVSSPCWPSASPSQPAAVEAAVPRP